MNIKCLPIYVALLYLILAMLSNFQCTFIKFAPMHFIHFSTTVKRIFKFWFFHNWKRHMHPNVYSSTIYNSQDTDWLCGMHRVGHDWSDLSCTAHTRHGSSLCRRSSTDEWIRKMWYIYTMEYYSAIKKSEFKSVLGRWMNLEPSKSKREKQMHILTHIYKIKKNGIDEPICREGRETQM